MCETCGCNVTHGNRHLALARNDQGVSAVSVLKNLLTENDRQAAHNRHHFDQQARADTALDGQQVVGERLAPRVEPGRELQVLQRPSERREGVAFSAT